MMYELFQILRAICYKLGLIADYVIEVGQDGIWTYEKRASGIASCFGTITCDARASVNTEGASYWRAVIYTFPNGLFADKPNITYGWERNYIGGFNLSNDTDKTKLVGYVWGFTNITLNGTQYLTIQAKGLWKDFVGGVKRRIKQLSPRLEVAA